ncbi:MAG: hypothetical protein IJ619_05750 [Eubacterium sp.]|nr:hypothetical protein [Eubacterium sp.]
MSPLFICNVCITHICLMVVGVGCKKSIPDVETVSEYSEEELRNLAAKTDENALISSWGDPLVAGAKDYGTSVR